MKKNRIQVASLGIVMALLNVHSAFGDQACGYVGEVGTRAGKWMAYIGNNLAIGRNLIQFQFVLNAKLANKSICFVNDTWFDRQTVSYSNEYQTAGDKFKIDPAEKKVEQIGLDVREQPVLACGSVSLRSAVTEQGVNVYISAPRERDSQSWPSLNSLEQTALLWASAQGKRVCFVTNPGPLKNIFLIRD